MAGEGGGEEAGASYYGGGAGGKLQTRTHRRPPSTPYDRPAARRKDGWISKFVDPASRLATRFFPSLFSKPDGSHPADGTGSNPEMEPSCEDTRFISDNNVSAEERNSTPVKVANVSPSRTDLDQEKEVGSVSEIEQFLKQKTFSRDEFIQLTGLLRSRTADLSTDYEHSRKDLDVEHLVADGSKDILHQEEFQLPVQEKQVQKLYHRTEKASTSLLQSAEHDDTSSSPVEIAKAFMGTWKTEPLSALQNVTLKESNTPTQDRVSSLLPPPSSTESPVCWPGAVIQDAPGFLTPQAQRGRVGLHNLPRTPYSRPSKGVDERPWNLSSTRLRQQQTPIFANHQVTRRRNYRMDDDFSTVGPVRRTRQLSTDIATPKRDRLSHVTMSSTSLQSNSHAFPPSSDFLDSKPSSTVERSAFLKGSAMPKFAVGSASVHPQSSKMAQKILEHLDRTVHSPKEKLAELGLMLARGNGTANSLGDIPIRQARETVNQEKGPLSLSPEGQNSVQASDIGDVDISNSKFSLSADCSGYFNTGFGIKPLESFKKVPDLQTSSHEDAGKRLSNDQIDDKNQPSSLQNHNDALQMHKLLSFNKRPTLMSISVANRDGKRTFSSDGPFGFTFPVSSASGGAALCEPPTPTMVPALVSKPSQAKEESAIPSFSFASSSSTKKSLNFSLGSTLNSGVHDTSMPKFTFGSQNNKGTVSFSSAVGAAFASLTRDSV